METTNPKREAAYWRSQADRQRERANALERALESKAALLSAFVDHFKRQTTEAATGGAKVGGVGQ